MGVINKLTLLQLAALGNATRIQADALSGLASLEFIDEKDIKPDNSSQNQMLKLLFKQRLLKLHLETD